ncbi:MAG: proline--tRNA ligase [Thermodesulfobacteriota bacterium]|mgnify:FL=1|nr:proline--tRNA ligase [Thermodesulfobacteriota bacterium]
MRLSNFLLSTLKEAPADAETESHKLMIRAGMIRKVAAGIYNFLPTGLRVFRKVENIIREEMNRANAIEVMMPFVTPSDLWEKSGRWDVYGKELLRFKDRADRDFCLGPTHEEVVTDLVNREVKSYKNLPLTVYQIQPKFRDEIRPRFGIMRAREFVMKDAYSFDIDEKTGEKSYNEMFEAYKKIFQRCGLTFKAVQADSGNIGGSSSHEFMVLAETGEDLILSCDKCEFAANVESASVKQNKIEEKEDYLQHELVETPGMITVDDVAKFLKRKKDNVVKTMILSTDQGLEAVLIRGDHELSLTKYKKIRNLNTVDLASAEEMKKLDTVKGFSGPLELNIDIYSDNAIQLISNFVVGANKSDKHYINVNPDRDFKIKGFGDFREAQDGDCCPNCKNGKLKSIRGIEVGHVFKLGTKYSESMDAKFVDKNGKEKNYFMGCYGIGVGRVVAAAIEQNYDEYGIKLPPAIAPFRVIIIPTDSKNSEVLELSEKLYQFLLNQNYDVLIDDRDENPGFKFKDADLIGVPFQLVIGPKSLADNSIEFKNRINNKSEKINKDDFEKIIECINGQ